MSLRAFRGGAQASRCCPSLGSGPGVGRNSFSNGLTTPIRSSVDATQHTSRRCLQIIRTDSLGLRIAATHATRHCSRDSISGRTCSERNATSTSSSEVTVLCGYGYRRCFSQSYRHFEEKNETKSKDQISSQSTQPEVPSAAKPRGIRNVIPKVIPVLTIHENIYTVPNILTFSRLIAAPFVGYAILHDAHAWALGLFAYAGVSDLLDGWIARRWKLQTVVGSVVDPMADKILMTILTVCLAYKGALPGKILNPSAKYHAI
ncbi:CDP-alcohol phosphatidyltransferase-domain-containing protein [Annulohypoxylon stygium]|nr:CDP-alcohol phosphatidyltransferase-domain-containing protein [Annulohypoxylon stygium]